MPRSSVVVPFERTERAVAEWINTQDQGGLARVLELTSRRLAELAAAPAAAGGNVEDPDNPAAWLDRKAVAIRIHRSVSWVDHHQAEIPGRRQLVPNGRVYWSRRAIEAWCRSAPC